MSIKNLRIFSQGVFLLLFLFLFIQTESKGMIHSAIQFGFSSILTLLFYYDSSCFPCNSNTFCFFLSLIVVLMTFVWAEYSAVDMSSGSAKQYRRFAEKKASGKIKKAQIPSNPTLAKGGTEDFIVIQKPRLNWFKAKYYILIMLLISSVFTLQIAGIMDPISLLIRSFSLSVYPLINYGLHSFFDALYYANIPLLVDVSESAYSFLKKNFLLFRQPHYFRQYLLG